MIWVWNTEFLFPSFPLSIDDLGLDICSSTPMLRCLFEGGRLFLKFWPKTTWTQDRNRWLFGRLARWSCRCVRLLISFIFSRAVSSSRGNMRTGENTLAKCPTRQLVEGHCGVNKSRAMSGAGEQGERRKTTTAVAFDSWPACRAVCCVCCVLCCVFNCCELFYVQWKLVNRQLNKRQVSSINKKDGLKSPLGLSYFSSSLPFCEEGINFYAHSPKSLIFSKSVEFWILFTEHLCYNLEYFKWLFPGFFKSYRPRFTTMMVVAMTVPS